MCLWRNRVHLCRSANVFVCVCFDIDYCAFITCPLHYLRVGGGGGGDKCTVIYVKAKKIRLYCITSHMATSLTGERKAGRMKAGSRCARVCAHVR